MKEAIKRILPSAGIILLLAALMAAVLLWMGKMEIISLPNFIMHIFSDNGQSGDITPAEDDGKIYEALEKRVSDDAVTLQLDVTAEEALEMLEAAGTPSEVYVENTVTLYTDDANKITKNKISLDAKKYRVVTDNGISVICDGSDISYRNSENKSVYSAERRSQSDFASMPDMSAIMDMLGTKTAAVELLRRPGENILYVEFIIDALNQTEKYYVSLDYGVVVRAQSYLEDRLVYSLTTQIIRTAQFQDSEFTIGLQDRQSH